MDEMPEFDNADEASVTRILNQAFSKLSMDFLELGVDPLVVASAMHVISIKLYEEVMGHEDFLRFLEFVKAQVQGRGDPLSTTFAGLDQKLRSL